jgi:hypothetical protein
MPNNDIEAVVAGFPHPTIIPIIGTPTYPTLARMHLKLSSNAASVQSNLGNGVLGLLYLTVSPAVYTTLSNTAFVPPVNPGTIAVIPDGATAAVTSSLVRSHTASMSIFREYNATDNALKTQLLGAVPDMYLRTLGNKTTGYATVTTRQMLVHLYKTYGRITAAHLIENDTKMKQDYDPNQPIEAFIEQIEDSVALADAAQTPYTSAQILTIAYNAMMRTGMFPEACREWRKPSAVVKTWPLFVTEFSEASLDLREAQGTSRSAGFHSANNANIAPRDNAANDAPFETEGLTNAFMNLASATATDRAAVAHLTATNASLTATVTQQTAKINALEAKLAAVGRNGGRGRQAPTYPPNDNYCWTHGYKLSRSHHSGSCKNPREGHQSGATKDNNMGGSQHNM